MYHFGHLLIFQILILLYAPRGSHLFLKLPENQKKFTKYQRIPSKVRGMYTKKVHKSIWGTSGNSPKRTRGITRKSARRIRELVWFIDFLGNTCFLKETSVPQEIHKNEPLQQEPVGWACWTFFGVLSVFWRFQQKGGSPQATLKYGNPGKAGGTTRCPGSGREKSHFCWLRKIAYS